MSCDNPSHADLIFPHSSCRLCSRGGGGVTPGLLDVWHMQQTLHLGADHSASTHGFVGRLHQDKTGRVTEDDLLPVCSLWQH